MKIVFMGTPDFAVPTLQTLIDSTHEVIGVVTQPDRPKGRSGALSFSPVKETALAAGVPVYQPEKMKDLSFLPVLEQLSPDVIVVVAFGQILPTEVLHLPQYGCINVHASLLPKLRGAAPIQWSVIDGDEESGVTIMQMDEGLDTGDMLLVKKYTLSEKETGGSLFDHLAQLGGSMVLNVLQQLEQGTAKPIPQDHEKHTYAKRLSKDMGNLDFSKSAAELERLIRGLNPWPSAYTYLDGKVLKIWEAEVISEDRLEGIATCVEKVPGAVWTSSDGMLYIQTGENILAVSQLQLAGKKRMMTDEFLRGYHLEEDTVFSMQP